MDEMDWTGPAARMAHRAPRGKPGRQARKGIEERGVILG
jgi:hypothetical protein